MAILGKPLQPLGKRKNGKKEMGIILTKNRFLDPPSKIARTENRGSGVEIWGVRSKSRNGRNPQNRWPRTEKLASADGSC